MTALAAQRAQSLWATLSGMSCTKSIDKMQTKKDSVVYSARDILNGITHREVVSFYNKSGICNLHGYANKYNIAQ